MRTMQKAVFLMITCCLLMIGCGDRQEDPATYRIAIARFQQETCTFCPGGDTDVERWTKLRPPYKGDELFRRMTDYVGKKYLGRGSLLGSLKDALMDSLYPDDYSIEETG